MVKKTLAEKMAENSRTVYEGMKTNTIGSFSSTENIKKNIIILDELKDLIPPLLESEFLSLKDNLQKHGCKDPLKIWQTNNPVINREGDLDQAIYVLIDGHNRFQLCNELQIPFNIQIDNFESLKEVRDFMIDFQLSRRNITPQQASYLRGIRYNTEKKEVSDNLKTSQNDSILPNGQNVHLVNFEAKSKNFEVVSNDNLPDGHFAHLANSGENFENFDVNSDEILPNRQNVHLADSDDISENLNEIFDDNLPNGQNVHLVYKSNKTTAQELGTYFNVDEKTIRRDAEFARGLEKLDPSFRKDILNGKIKVEKSKIQKISKAKDIDHLLKSPEELNLVYNNLISEELQIVVPQVQNLVQKRYFQLNAKLQKVYNAKKIKNAELEALKVAFQDFIDVL
jgi:hypothetical protein